jgi:hypothetical protein
MMVGNMHPPIKSEFQMDWILEKSLELYQSLIKGELTQDQVFTILIPLVLVGIVLARKSILEFIKSQLQRIREYIQLQKAKESIHVKQERASTIANEIGEKLYAIQELKSAFNIKMNELLGRIDDPSFTFETEDNKRVFLKKNILYLDESYQQSLDTIKDIETLLKDIAEIKRAEVLRKNPKQIMLDARREAQARRNAKKSVGNVNHE